MVVLWLLHIIIVVVGRCHVCIAGSSGRALLRRRYDTIIVSVIFVAVAVAVVSCRFPGLFPCPSVPFAL